MKTPKLLSVLCLLVILVGSCTKNTPDIERKPPVVNAGPSVTITLPVDSAVLTGSVTDTGGKVVSYLWSEVSGPNVPVISTEGSLSTKVHGLVAGSYVFQLTATDTFGLTGVDTLQVTVNPRAPIILNSNNNLNEVEYIGGGGNGVDQTNAAPAELGAETWTINSALVYVRSVFRFDFSTLPALPVKSAKLTLYSNPTPHTANLSTPNFGTTNAMYIQRVNSSWTPTGALWPSQPTVDTAGQVNIPQTNASSLDLVNVDVTAIVNKMIASGNYGFMIRLQNEMTYNSRIFCSSRYSDTTKHPVLALNY